MFSCEFYEISHNTFLSKPFGRLLLHKHLLCLLSYYDLSPFQKRCHTYFFGWVLFRLNLQFGNKSELNMVPSLPLLSCESSVSVKENPDRKKKCKTLSQKPIFNLVKHLGRTFSCKNVNSSTLLVIFAKKAPL